MRWRGHERVRRSPRAGETAARDRAVTTVLTVAGMMTTVPAREKGGLGIADRPRGNLDRIETAARRPGDETDPTETGRRSRPDHPSRGATGTEKTAIVRCLKQGCLIINYATQKGQASIQSNQDATKQVPGASSRSTALAPR